MKNTKRINVNKPIACVQSSYVHENTADDDDPAWASTCVHEGINVTSAVAEDDIDEAAAPTDAVAEADAVSCDELPEAVS